MAALIIGPEERARITEAVTRARAKPIPFEVLKAVAAEVNQVQGKTVTLAERKDSAEKRPQSEQVLLPTNFRLAVSFEQQPAGLVEHVSMSIDTPGRVPNAHATLMMLEALGFSDRSFKADNFPHNFVWNGRQVPFWTEEYTFAGQPGGLAFNFLFVMEEAK